MIEILIEILAGGVFELFAEFFAWIGRERNHDKATDPRSGTASPSSPEIQNDPWSPAVQRSRHALTAKLMIGASAGAFWGYYVGTSSDVSWPLTFWSFAGIGGFALTARIVGVSNEGFASRINNRVLRSMATFTPERFSSWAAVSLLAAAGVAGGFLAASGGFN